MKTKRLILRSVLFLALTGYMSAAEKPNVILRSQA
jgi:hypothetical protein